MFRLATLAAFAVALAGCQKSESKGTGRDTKQPTAPRAPGGVKSDEVLAKVGDVTITVGELQDQLDRQAPYIKAQYTSLERKREFLDNLIRFEVLAAEAQRRGLDKDPEVVRTMKSVMVQKLMREDLDIPVAEVTDAEVAAYYNANLGEYVRHEQKRASAIVVKDRTQAERIAAEAQGEAGRTNKAFRDLVEKYSTDAVTKERGGDVRYFARQPDGEEPDRPPQPVVDAAFALPRTGAVSGAIDAGDGTFWVIKETGHRRAATKTLSEVEQQIRSKLQRDKRLDAQDEYVEQLRAKASIEIDEDNLEKVRVQARKQPEAEPHDQTPPP